MPRLEVKSGKAAGQSVELHATLTTLGNRRNASLEIKDPWVGFNHAQVTREGDQYFIADMGTRNGTTVNGKKVDRAPHPLAPGDRIMLGRTEIVFVAETPASAPAAPPATPELLEKVARLERELALARKDLDALRETHVARERDLSDANVQIQKLTAQPKAGPELAAARDEAARWKKSCDDVTAKARIKVEELTRHVKTLEARLQQGGGDLAGQLLEKDREIARLREEGRRVQEDARVRLLEAAEKMQKESGGDVAELQEQLDNAERRAVEAEKELGAAQRQVETLEAKVKELDRKLEGPSPAEKELRTLKDELKAYEQALEERNADVARLEAAIKRGGASAPEPEPVPAPDAGELAKAKARVAELEKQVIDLRTQVDEVNQDMLEQEDELRAEIVELEKKLAAVAAAGDRPGVGSVGSG